MSLPFEDFRVAILLQKNQFFHDRLLHLIRRHWRHLWNRNHDWVCFVGSLPC